MSSPDSTPPSNTARRHPLASAQTVSATGAFTRLSWILIGPIALLAYLLHLSRTDPAWTSWQSIGFWAIVALLLLGRYVDWKGFDGSTMEGRATTLADFKRYVAYLMTSSGTGWLAALAL